MNPILDRARTTLRELYSGETRAARRFQISVVAIDLVIIAFFVISPVLQDSRSYLWIDYLVAAILALELGARALAATNFLNWVRQPIVLIDIFILLSLLIPQTMGNFGFLRSLRLASLSHSGLLWRPLSRWGFDRWRDTCQAVTNLLTFLLVASGFIYTFFFPHDTGIAGYVDAFYFTVTTVTTTGFGDIVLPGIAGKLTAIVTMIVGITLFVRIAQSLFRPTKVLFSCPQCALQRHELDAVFCKACGHPLKIPDEGIG